MIYLLGYHQRGLLIMKFLSKRIEATTQTIASAVSKTIQSFQVVCGLSVQEKEDKANYISIGNPQLFVKHNGRLRGVVKY